MNSGFFNPVGNRTYYRKNKDPLFFRGSLFFFASHPEAEIDTKTSGRGFSSVALRGFFYLALGCVVQKTDPDFQKTTPQNAGNNRPNKGGSYRKNKDPLFFRGSGCSGALLVSSCVCM